MSVSPPASSLKEDSFADHPNDVTFPDHLSNHKSDSERTEMGLGKARDEERVDSGQADARVKCGGTEKPALVNDAMPQSHENHHFWLPDQIEALKIKMKQAIHDDAQDVMEGKPGLRKLAMIKEVP